MTVLPDLASADGCPVCHANHWAAGQWWACGQHRHRLQPSRMDPGGRVAYTCPAHRCPTAVFGPTPVPEEPMTTTPAETQPSTELVIRGDQDDFDKFQLAALRTRGIENVPTPERKVFFHHCVTRGLDPFAGHATIVPFRERNGATRWTIITEIDGFRFLGHRAAAQHGDTIAMPDPVYVDQDGNETTHWVKRPSEPPGMVKQTILKNGAPFTGVASYWEFGNFDRNKDGTPDYTRPKGMTRDMPANQTAKCAEAQAWRKAYQDVFDNLPIHYTVQPTAPPAAAAATWHAAAIQDADDHADVAAVQGHWDRLGVDDQSERLNLTAMLAGADFIPDSYNDLSAEELATAAKRLKSCTVYGDVSALIDRGDKPGSAS